MSTTKKVLTSTIAFILFSMPFTNVAMAASEESPSKEGAYEGIEAVSTLEKTLKEDNITQEELDELDENIKEELAKEESGPSTQKYFGTAKKALKFVVDHPKLIPGKKLRGWVEKYGGKAVDQLDMVEVTTKAGMVNALKPVMPEHVAQAIADFTFTFVL